MTTSPVAELAQKVAGDVGVISRAWAASEGNHRQQSQVAATALTHFATQAADLLQLLHADAVLAEAEAAEPVRQIP